MRTECLSSGLTPDLELCREKPENPGAKMALASKGSQAAGNGNSIRWRQELRGTDISLFAVAHCSRRNCSGTNTWTPLGGKQPPLSTTFPPLGVHWALPPILLSRGWLQMKTSLSPWHQPVNHSFLTRQVCFAKGSGNRAATLSGSAASLRMGLNKISDNPFTKRSTDF